MPRFLLVPPRVVGGPATLAAFAVALLAACGERSPTGVDARPLFDHTLAFEEFNADAFTGAIRIGVVPSASAITLGSAGSYVVRDKGTGSVLLEGAGDDVTVTLESALVVRRNYRLQVACTGEVGRDRFLSLAGAQGYVTYVEHVPSAGCWRLFIGEFSPTESFRVRNAFRNEVISKGLAGTDSFWKIVSIVEGVAQLKVARGATEVTTGNAVALEPANALVRINGIVYRGVGEAALNSGGTLSGINTVDLEEYLYGVVPRELPPVPFDELEALKAQAVAARTYAIANLGKRRADGYDLLATTADQVYGGYAAEHPLSSGAVDATAGIVAVHDGKPIAALYSSTSGGYTANNEDVFSSAPIPYLRGVPDAPRGRAMEHVPSLEVFRNHANPTSLRNAREGDYESDWSRYHRWTFEWTAEEISAVIGAYAQRPVGRVLAINVRERAPSGRVLRIEYVTEAGTFEDTKDRVRSSLKYLDAAGVARPLPSTLVFVAAVVDPRTKEVTGFVAYGGGFGHGVGLSQTGAVGMAERGAHFEEILRHYYQGIGFARWSD